MSLKINYRVEKAQEKQYLSVPFLVPENIESATIRYSYSGDEANSVPGSGKNIIDFSLKDYLGNEVGASGSSKRKITVSESYSTPGYKRTAVGAGQWQIICGAYMVRDEGVDITYEIELTPKRFRYLKGDTHTHSVNSDGNLTDLELATYAKQAGLDFIMTTDHNNFAHNSHLPEVEGLSIIPGVELTHYNGHMNIWGPEIPYSGSYAVNTLEEFISRADEARAKGGLSSINHPLCSMCPWKWSLTGFDHDAVEIWNGPMRRDNLKAISWWHGQLVLGRKLVAVGGSDFHRNYLPFIKMLARPTTRVYAEANAKADILNAVKNGRAVITATPRSSMIYLNCGQAVPGDTVAFSDGCEVTVEVDELRKGHTLNVIGKNGVLYTYRAKKSGPHSVCLPVKEKGFIRAEITCKAKGMAKFMSFVFDKITQAGTDGKSFPPFVYAITNPIYFD